MGACCSTCNQGGALSLAPKEVIKGEANGEDVRFNMLYRTFACFAPNTGFFDKQYGRLKDALAVKGVDPGLVDFWFRDRLADAQGKTQICCPRSLACAFPLVWFMLPLLMQLELKRVISWDQALRSWQEDFNREVLEPKGMFLKTQSNCRMHRIKQQNGSYRERKYTARWFAIALTEEESEKLKSEPHITGHAGHVACSCIACCRGGSREVHERELCCHP